MGEVGSNQETKTMEHNAQGCLLMVIDAQVHVSFYKIE